MSARTVLFVVLTGPIASGKSTVGRLAVAGSSLPFVPEDVDSRAEDREVLARYYAAVAEFDALRAAPTTGRGRIAAAQEAVFATQVHFIRRRSQGLREQARLGLGGLVERHPSDDLEIFSRRNLENGLLTSEQFADLQGLVRRELAEVPPPRLHVFLHAEPARLRERIRRRGRAEEADLLRAENPYLAELNALYERWYERCPGDKVRLVTDALEEAAIAERVRAEMQARGII